MITEAKRSPTRPSASKPITATALDALAIGSTIKQNIVEKLPTINTQVRLSIESEIVEQVALQTASLFNMISSAVKSKSIEVKEKVKDYIAHTGTADSAHGAMK